MTEKQLRERLTEYLSPADLQDSRKEALLKQIRQEAPPAPEKGEPNMFRPNKFRTVLVLAAIVSLLSFTVALAAGLGGYVNYKGERVEINLPKVAPTPMPAEPTKGLSESEFSDLAFQITQSAPSEHMVWVLDERSGNDCGKEAHAFADSLSELEELVGESMLLPTIPEGYAFVCADVYLTCDYDSAYEVTREEITPEGLQVLEYAIPEGAAVAYRYSINLINLAGDRIFCWAQLNYAGSEQYFSVNEEDVVQTPTVPGMDDALLITSLDAAELKMRRALDKPITLWSAHPEEWEWESYDGDTYTSANYQVDSATTVPADVLLSIFAK